MEQQRINVRCILNISKAKFTWFGCMMCEEAGLALVCSLRRGSAACEGFGDAFIAFVGTVVEVTSKVVAILRRRRDMVTSATTAATATPPRTTSRLHLLIVFPIFYLVRPGQQNTNEVRVPSWLRFRFSIFSLGRTKTCQSLQTTASFPPSGRDLSALLGSE